MKTSYRLIGRNLHQITVNGQFKHVTIVPSYIDTLSKAVDWYEGLTD
jgi:hypothetical protein